MRFLMIYFSWKFGKKNELRGISSFTRDRLSLNTYLSESMWYKELCRISYFDQQFNKVNTTMFLPLFSQKKAIFRRKWLILAFLVEIRSYNVSNTYRNMSILLRKKPILCQKWLINHCSGSFQSCFRSC